MYLGSLERKFDLCNAVFHRTELLDSLYLCKNLALAKIDIAYMSDLCTAFANLITLQGQRKV